MVVLDVGFEVFGQIGNALGKHRHLDLGVRIALLVAYCEITSFFSSQSPTSIIVLTIVAKSLGTWPEVEDAERPQLPAATSARARLAPAVER